MNNKEGKANACNTSSFSPGREVLYLILRPKQTRAALANPKAEVTCDGFSFCLHSTPTTIVMAVSASRDLKNPLLSTEADISFLNINILTEID